MQQTAITAAYEIKSNFDSVAETTNPKADTIERKNKSLV